MSKGLISKALPAAPAVAAGSRDASDGDTSTIATVGLWLYLLFIISWFLQLGERYSILGAIRFDLLLVMVIAVLCLVASADRPANQSMWTSRRFVFWLVFYAVLTLPLIEWPGSVIKAGLPNFFKAAVFALFTGSLVRNRKGLIQLLLVFVGCQVFRVLEPLYMHHTQGYWGSQASMAHFEFLNRLAGAPADIINPNGLAFVIVTTLTFCHFLCPLSKIGKLFYLGYLPVAMWALLLTGSRTGLLALAMVLAGIWWKSQHKLTIAAIVVVTAVSVFPILPDDLKDRYESLVSSDTKNSATAGERNTALKSSLMVASRRPLFGHGLGTSGEANANFGTSEQPAHNLYAEVAEELGFLGLLLFLGFMITLCKEVNRARANSDGDNPRELVRATTDALQVYLAMNVTFSLASYGLSGPEWYLMAGISDVILRLQSAPAAISATAATPSDSGVSIHSALRGVLSTDPARAFRQRKLS
jgi:O-antigen ligase